jgi:hypothetical protein
MKSKTVEYIKVDQATAVDISWREHSLKVTGFDTDTGQGFDFELYCHDDKLFNNQGYSMQCVAEGLSKRFPDRFADIAGKAGFTAKPSEDSGEEKI